MRGEVLHPLSTAAPADMARGAVDKGWRTSPWQHQRANPPRNCEGTATSDDNTGHTGASKTWLIRRRQHHADRSIRTMRADLIEASKGDALRQQAGYTTAILSLSPSTSALQYGRRPYRGSASAETGTCAHCWCTERVRCCGARSTVRSTTGSLVGRSRSRPRAGRTRRRWRWRTSSRASDGRCCESKPCTGLREGMK